MSERLTRDILVTRMIHVASSPALFLGKETRTVILFFYYYLLNVGEQTTIDCMRICDDNLISLPGSGMGQRHSLATQC